MSHPVPSQRKAIRAVLALATLATLAVAPAAHAGEGGTSHITPGSLVTMADLPGTASAAFVKPMYMHYSGDISAKIPTAAGIVANADASSNTLAVVGGYIFDTTVLGGAHWTIAAALPYIWLDIEADSEDLGGRRIANKVDGFGDIAVMPVMLAWKDGNWQYDAILQVFAPTGSYELGRLGNTGLNYWTFNPIVGFAYANAKTGLNAAMHAGLAFNTANDATDYRSGNLLNVEASIQQVFPAASGFGNVGLEGWWFDQVTCDSGAGATLGCFKGRTAGIGPVLGYVQPIGRDALIFELKWLPELETRNRLKGDYLWFKMVYKF